MVVQSTGMQFLVLYLVEAVGTHVQPVAPAPQVVHQLTGSIHQAGFGGTEVQEQVAGLQAEVSSERQADTVAQRAPEAFDNEIVACNLAFGIACPQVDVGLPVAVVEDVGI